MTITAVEALKAACSGSGVTPLPVGTVSERYKEECRKSCRETLKWFYKERTDINWDMVDIWCVNEPRLDSSGHQVGHQENLKFGNLYSYVLSEGIVIPYSEWVYEKEVKNGDKTYVWNNDSFNGIAVNEDQEIADTRNRFKTWEEDKERQKSK